MAQRGDTILSDAAFLQAFTVEHVLDEVEAKRRIVQRYQEIQEDRAGLTHYGVTAGAVQDRAEGMQLAALMVVADLAAIYADRPGWREEWRPAALWSSHTRVWSADDPETR